MAPTKSTRPRSVHLSVSDSFKVFVLDQLQDLSEVIARPMFGGVGLYHRGTFFGLLARDTLYLKVGDANRADYEHAGMKPFKPYPNRSATMKYYAVPVDVLESVPELLVWARKAIAVAGVEAPRKEWRDK